MGDLPAHILPVDVVEHYKFVCRYLPCAFEIFWSSNLKGHYLCFKRIFCTYLGLNRNVTILGVRGERGPIR